MLDVIQKGALAGGEVLLKYFRQEQLEITNKTTHQNIVTKADIESQKIIHDSIITDLGKKGIDVVDIGFIGEEKLHAKGEHTFVIDPLDGTSNFATGVEDFCVLIGYLHNKTLQSGVMYFPTYNKWYIAEKDKGAYVIKNGVKTRLKTKHKNLKDTFLVSSLSYTEEVRLGLPGKIIALKNHFRGVRMYGCAGTEIYLVAENIGGAALLAGCSIWDIAPGKLILDESGFGMYDFSGKEIVFDLENPTKKYPFIACDPQFKEELTKALSAS
ncbi:hypothetical protein A3A93_01980 [Candidatus Roizmanbacteria bacterium RIFCSPLOWO2_01_FULL_38_12]|uniref:Inositol monophosphatase n=1 Tax=Candidatus Roizmanbacteria bacterium RIFCSPLOWO2_01_FULL_38_12 TaxID=1802061 RepID=A0A1F7IY06_9BACT|nr:MAG: hypothetical protein A2861_01500 [Candidatus Roizmanbacteria bacterium RIFCSPHIGHO2_01_FULL_38_15]OGK35295.1 MAG: hypothetical protein A3F59_02905 [Candidatus Roizmanbacteria bacterium RIFCSPHIGHO2_12_FULL_38_13]OGK48221.1 MAG: hypothetical protein A3A93_01980 [Candidatus Roizmanbacteria bacterium RIFCSPLOWO2_01_FULL_38_12]